MAASSESPLIRLGRPGNTLSETLALLTEVERGAVGAALSIGISANVTTDLLATYLRRHALLRGAVPAILSGDFDSHYDNVVKFAAERVDCLVLLHHFDSIVPFFESAIPLLPEDEIEALLRRFQDMLSVALAAGALIRRIVIPLFHRTGKPSVALHRDVVDDWIDRFNVALTTLAAEHPNVRLVSSANAIAVVGWEKAFSARHYYRFKAPYSQALCDELASGIIAVAHGSSRYLKALVLDCDNTLWGGIIGEDLLDGIKLSPHDYPGAMYLQAQRVYATLQQKGILLCLCSKNNAEDVDAVLTEHTAMVLRDSHIITKRVNWDDKPANLLSIAQELNIGLDSIAFVDDSDFECDAVRTSLPAVSVFQVPKNIFEYPALLHDIQHAFLAGVDRTADADKTAQYRQRKQAIDEQTRFTSQEEYLQSLGLKVTIGRNEHSRAARIAELSQKSNQFNVTTPRYTETDVRTMMDTADMDVFSIHVSDRFGDSGLTGVIVTRHASAQASIEAFLMSCRVLGRGIEFAIWGTVFETCRNAGATAVSASYVQTAKNAQVADFFDRLGLRRVPGTGDHQTYEGELVSLTVPSPPHIEIVYAG